MSYIDVNDYEYVGNLGGLPLYHPLENYTDPEDFLAGPEHLVLGGGSGEHEPIIFDIVSCLAWPVMELASDLDETGYVWQRDFDVPTVAELDLLHDCIHREQGRTDFTHWGSQAWLHFHAAATSTANYHPYSDDGSLEMWLEASVGEYVLVCRPDLIPELPVGRETVVKLQAFYGSHPRWGNVTCLPQGYQVHGFKSLRTVSKQMTETVDFTAATV